MFSILHNIDIVDIIDNNINMVDIIDIFRHRVSIAATYDGCIKEQQPHVFVTN